ncbi:MAG: tetratricopeptide repeat protein, partial [Elusimicrobiota bacterium]
PLSFFFIMTAFLLWRKAHLEDASSLRRFGALAAFVLACLSKESALVLPPLLAAHDFLFSDGNRPGRPVDKGAWAGLLALTGAYLYWRFGLLQPHPDSLRPVSGAALSLESLGWYTLRLFWPSPLCLETTLVPFSGAWLSRWLLAGAALAAPFCSVRRPLRAFLSLWILLGLLPVLHLIPFANHSPVADRYLYLPAAGFCLLLAGEPRLKPAGLALLGLAWGAALVTRNLLYLDERAFLEQTASCAPANPRAQALLGAFQAERLGDLRGAAATFERAYSLAPELRTLFVEPGLVHSAGSAYVLGLLNLRMGEPAEAERRFSRGLLREEETPAARAALLLRRGDSRRALGKSEEASCDYQRALALVPDWDPARARARASGSRPCTTP